MNRTKHKEGKLKHVAKKSEEGGVCLWGKNVLEQDEKKEAKALRLRWFHLEDQPGIHENPRTTGF